MDRREGAYLLLADIEEAETGDQGKVRQLLSKAVRAPRDPAWVADGVVSERWAPVSPVTGRLDAFEWRAPMERLGQLIDSRRGRAGTAAPVAAVPDEPAEAGDAEVDRSCTELPAAGDGSGQAEPAGEDHVTPVDGGRPLPPCRPMPEAVEPAEEPARLPDDPGVDPDDEAEKSPRRFRLF